MDSFKNINCTFIPILIFPRLLPSEHHWVTNHHWITPPVWPGRQSCGRYTECMPLALLRGGYQHLLPHLARSSWSTVTKLLHCCKERCFRNTYPTTRLHILYLEGLVYSNYCFLVFFFLCLRLFCLPGLTTIARPNWNVDISAVIKYMHLFFYLTEPILFF